MTTYELIQAARRRIASQSSVPMSVYCDNEGNYCAIGALGREAYGPGFGHPPHLHGWILNNEVDAALTSLLDIQETGICFSMIALINDQGGRESVLALFDRWLADNAPVEEETECLVAA